jgi:alginate O-acetyltransferase complex protein AlgI
MFYAWWRVDFLALLIASTAFTFLVGLLMERSGRDTRQEWRWMIFGVVGNLAALVYFKYANFIVGNVNEVKTSLGFSPMAWERIVLPVGLSFYVMQSVSYLLDIRNLLSTMPLTRRFLPN